MDDDNTINNPKDANELYKDKLLKIKKQLEAISPVHIINDALQCADKIRSEKASTFKKDDFLQLTKAHAVQSFLDNIKGKSITDTIAEFNKKTDEYNSGMQVILDKTHKENNQYKSQCQSILDQNIALREEKVILNEEYNKLEMKLQDSESEIKKLQSRFALFKEFKELFDVLFNEFPNLSPIEIMEDIKIRKREGSLLVSDYSNALETIEVLRKEKAEQEAKTHQQVEGITMRAYQMESNYKERISEYENIVHQLKNDVSQFQHHKDENIQMHNSLYTIYNLIYDTVGLHKEVKVNEELDIKEEDFRVDMLNKDEIVRYIKIMIKSFHFSSSDKLLRETIAYANMMVRTFMKDKINKRFAPVEVFFEIKKLLETKHEKNLKLKQDCFLFKDKIANLEKNNKTLLSNLDILKNQVENLQAYAKRSNKQQVAVSANIGSMGHKDSIVCVSKSTKAKHSTTTPTERKMDRKDNESEERLIDSGSALKLKIKHNKAKKKKQQSSLTGKTTTNRRTVYSYTLTKKNMENYVLPVYDNDRDLRSNKKLSANKGITNKGDGFDYNEVSSESSDDNNNNVLSEEESEQFKDLKTAPNRDKLLKTHGFQSFITNLNGFKELIDHTNRIFLYKSKMLKGTKVSKTDNLNRKLEKKFIDYSSAVTGSTPYSNADNQLEKHFKTRIVANINKIINSVNESDK